MNGTVYACSPCLFSLYMANCLSRKSACRLTDILLSTRPLRVRGRPVRGLDGLRTIVGAFGVRYTKYLLLVGQFAPALKGLWTRRGGLWSFAELERRAGVRVWRSSDFSDKETRERILAARPKVFASMFLDQIVRKDLLSLEGIHFLNVHPSKLPEFRGADPITAQMLAGTEQFGVTLHRMTPAVDAGDVLSFSPVKAHPQDTHLSLAAKAAAAGAGLISNFLAELDDGASPKGERQDDSTVRHKKSSYPSGEEIDALYAAGRRLYTWGDVGRVLRFEAVP